MSLLPSKNSSRMKYFSAMQGLQGAEGLSQQQLDPSTAQLPPPREDVMLEGGRQEGFDDDDDFLEKEK